MKFWQQFVYIRPSWIKVLDNLVRWLKQALCLYIQYLGICLYVVIIILMLVTEWLYIAFTYIDIDSHVFILFSFSLSFIDLMTFKSLKFNKIINFFLKLYLPYDRFYFALTFDIQFAI